MAFHEYKLVGESDIYDKQGFRKTIFLQMAGLIQEKTQLEDDTANPNLGWVVQSERWIAERLGISESAVYKAIKTFVQDGWWIREERRDSNGHLHCRWRLAEAGRGCARRNGERVAVLRIPTKPTVGHSSLAGRSLWEGRIPSVATRQVRMPA